MGELTLKQLAERVLRLEDEVRELKSRNGAAAADNQEPWWRKFVGMHKDDEAFDEVVKIMEKNREKDRQDTIRRIEREERRERARKQKKKRTRVGA